MGTLVLLLSVADVVVLSGVGAIGMVRRTREDRRLQRLQRVLKPTAGDGDQDWGEVFYEIGYGYRESREGSTVYLLEEDCIFMGQRVKLTREEKRSGKRWFREEYPTDWAIELSPRELEVKASRCLGDYGKEFVEQDGRWYVARKV